MIKLSDLIPDRTFWQRVKALCEEVSSEEVTVYEGLWGEARRPMLVFNPKKVGK